MNLGLSVLSVDPSVVGLNFLMRFCVRASAACSLNVNATAANATVANALPAGGGEESGERLLQVCET